MRFDLTRPCDACPFRIGGIDLLLTRVVQIIQDLEHRTFECHKTVYGVQPRVKGRFTEKVHQHCAGALIVMAKTGKWGDMQQIAGRLGLFDPAKLDLSSPVYNSFQKMVEECAKNGRRGFDS